MPGTWKNTPEGKAGLSCKDADANVRAAVRHMAVHESLSPWWESKYTPVIGWGFTTPKELLKPYKE